MPGRRWIRQDGADVCRQRGNKKFRATRSVIRSDLCHAEWYVLFLMGSRMMNRQAGRLQGRSLGCRPPQVGAKVRGV